MKKMKNKKRCYALAEYMEVAVRSDDPRDRVAACPVVPHRAYQARKSNPKTQKKRRATKDAPFSLHCFRR